jgi:hypothetical protein
MKNKIEEFKQSLTNNVPPVGISIFLEALWYDAKGQWEKAHEIAQTDEGNQKYDRIHAYLHRKEGDIFNSKYWYRRIQLNTQK